jgi:hypothetical protein
MAGAVDDDRSLDQQHDREPQAQPSDGALGRAHANRWLWLALILMTLWRIAIAWSLPVTLDEAYYADWARHLAWGYFDHPPGVALLALGTRLLPGSALAARLGTVLAATLTLIVLVRFYRSCGLRSGTEQLLALVIAFATLPGLIAGVVTTPETVLVLFWAIALHEGLAALRGAHRRWLTAGIATGLGLLSKYTMVLIGPVFLLSILWAKPKALRTRWPYLGGLLALLVFAPNLLWNAENHWVTMRFQLGHGFASETGHLVSNPLPAPVQPAAEPSAHAPRSGLERLAELLRYLGTQVALWGFILIAVIGSLRGDRERTLAATRKGIEGTALKLLVVATLFPLAFFGLFATFSDVEANWPGVYLLSAAPLAAMMLARRPRLALAAAGLNALVVTAYAAHATTGFLALPSSLERISRETHGYRELAMKTAQLDGPVFTDRYQLTAMLRFYDRTLAVNQWPDITRPSEYLRGQITRPPSLEDIAGAGGFWLITRRGVPPAIPRFHLLSAEVIYDCGNSGLQAKDEGSNGEPPCRKPLHVWHVLRYASVKE